MKQAFDANPSVDLASKDGIRRRLADQCLSPLLILCIFKGQLQNPVDIFPILFIDVNIDQGNPCKSCGGFRGSHLPDLGHR